MKYVSYIIYTVLKLKQVSSVQACRCEVLTMTTLIKELPYFQRMIGVTHLTNAS